MKTFLTVLMFSMSLRAADVVLGRIGDLTWTGSGLNRIATFSSGAFSPVSISGCELWLDASDAGSITESGGKVSVWADKSGNGRNAYQDNATNQPDYFPGYVYFGNGPGMYATNATISQPYTIVLVAGAELGQRILQAQTDNSLIAFRRGDGYCVYCSDVVYGPALCTDTNAHICVLTSESNTASLFFDGATKADAVGNTHNFGRLVLGKFGGYSAETTQAMIHEVIVYSHALTPTERQQLEAYLAAKWSVSL